jgi:hypothetical protein
MKNIFFAGFSGKNCEMQMRLQNGNGQQTFQKLFCGARWKDSAFREFRGDTIPNHFSFWIAADARNCFVESGNEFSSH